MESGLTLLRELIGSCTEAEKKAAEYILANPKAVVFYTIAELAKQSDTSTAAIVRLCKKTGLSGYRELQMLIAKDIYSPQGEQEAVLPDFQLDSRVRIEDLASNSITQMKKALDTLSGMLNPDAVRTAADRMSKARSIAAFGIGASAVVAYDLSQKIIRLGIPCSFSFDPDIQITSACGLCASDVAVAVSYSGNTPSVIKAAEEARISGAFVVSLTRIGTNPLARLSDCALCIPASESLFRLGATVSRITQLAVVDILYGAIASRNIERAASLVERSMKATHKGA